VSAGKLYGTFEKSEGPNGVVSINATENAHIQIHQLNMEVLNINLDHSRLDIQNTTTAILSGALKNGSNLYSYKSIGKLNLEIDPTSTYSLSKRIDH
jgi:hypothetical protein